jgi:chemotaxis protein methyltransferase CheR
MIKITPAEIQLITKYIKDISGIHLDQKKTYLLETRLNSLMKAHDCATYKDLYNKAHQDPARKIERDIIDAITTNETLFFRDKTPFELLQHKILPELIDIRTRENARKPAIRIWSAAASTGQELYSICIVLKELLQADINHYDIKLFGTDISDAVLAQASYGKYNKFEIERGLDLRYLHKYFTLSGDFWKVKDELRAMVNFRKLNLLKPFTGIGKFDIILCRNVAIYFTLADRQRLFARLAEHLTDDGYLIIGSTESLTGVSPIYGPKRHLRAIYYQKKLL